MMAVNANISFNASRHNLTRRMIVQILHSVMNRHLNAKRLYSAVQKVLIIHRGKGVTVSIK